MKFNHIFAPLEISIDHRQTLDIGERAAALGHRAIDLGFEAIALVRELHAPARRRNTFDVRTANLEPYGGSVTGDSTLLELILRATQHGFLPLVVTDAEGNVIEGASPEGVVASTSAADKLTAAIVTVDDEGNTIPPSLRIGTEPGTLGIGQVLLSDGDPANDIVINTTVIPGAPSKFNVGAFDIRENVAPAPPANPGEGGETPTE